MLFIQMADQHFDELVAPFEVNQAVDLLFAICIFEVGFQLLDDLRQKNICQLT